MNKRDILNMCLDKLHENDQYKPESPIDMHYKIHGSYMQCKTAALDSGYSGQCFTQIWQQACKIHEHELNIRENTDPLTIH